MTENSKIRLVKQYGTDALSTGLTTDKEKAKRWQKQLIRDGYEQTKLIKTYDEYGKWPGAGIDYYSVEVRRFAKRKSEKRTLAQRLGFKRR